MNHPSPFIPQGSFLESKRLRSRSKIKVMIFTVLGFHAVLLGIVLSQGCRRNRQAGALNELASPDSNSALALPNVPTNIAPSVEVSLTNTPLIPELLPVPTVNTSVITKPFAPLQTVTTKDYRVEKGDTLAGIAKRYRIHLSALTEANPGIDPTKLKVGQILQVPENSDGGAAPIQTRLAAEKDAVSQSPEIIYVVKSGDTLSRIAQTHGTTVKAIRDLNRLGSDQIMVGRKLKLPLRSTRLEEQGMGLRDARASNSLPRL